jgi:hypothetical protein
MPVAGISLAAAAAVAGLALAALAAGAQEQAAQAAAAEPAAQPAAPAPALHYSNKWRLQISEGANNDGVMNFRVTPKGGSAIDVPVSLKKGRGEDGCARDIRDTFKKTLDKDVYRIELDDGEDVLIKVRKGPYVSIELVDSTVKGTRVNFDRE